VAPTSTAPAPPPDSSSDEEEGPPRKPQLSLVVVGHVDAGKSTLMGHLLYELQLVPQKEMHRAERESRERGKASFKFAYLMDAHEEERERGVTVDVAVKRFETPSRRVLLLDAPGHRDFVANMITGAAQADAALLVVPAATGEFESSFLENAQTREHAVIVSRLGVSRLVVAVNKMDAVAWSRDRFEEVRAALVPFLVRDAGFKEEDVALVPVSGLTGENLTKRTAGVPDWVPRTTLLEAVDALPAAKRPVRKPMRLVVADAFKVVGATIVGGKLESGRVRVGDRVLVAPLGETAQVKALTCHGESVRRARAGDNVDVTLSHAPDVTRIHAGFVLCDARAPIPVASAFRARVHALPLLSVPILNGSQLVLYAHSTEVPCTVERIVGLVGAKPGAPAPRLVRRGQTADLLVRVARPVCVEAMDDLRPLSRIVLRSGDASVAAGFVTEVTERADVVPAQRAPPRAS